MIFNSYHFLLFFPVVTLLYFILPKRVRWLWLLAASYYFYMCWNASYALLIALSTVVTYACALGAQRYTSKGVRKGIMLAGLGVNLAILCFFKYFNFFGDTVNRVLGAAGLAVHVPHVDVLLPVGISFYTFQALGYMIDVYRGTVKAERNLLRYALFVSFFPQLVAGPIERSRNLLRQVNEGRDFDWDRAIHGLLIMLLGFFEKLVIADRASIYVNAVYDKWVYASGWQIALATVAFAFQIYGDFGGYSHIAIGAAKVLGYDLMENFRQPYFAVSVRDFWHRWHVSLSTWFRDYVYIPLGGSRVGRLRRMVNLMITFTVSGLWHGAALNYVAWGAANGLLQILEGLLPKPEKTGALSRALRMLVTFVLICGTWMLFRCNALSTAIRMFMRMFTAFGAPAYETGFSFWQGAVLVLSVAVLLIVDIFHERGVDLSRRVMSMKAPVMGALTLLAVLLILVFGIWGPGYDAQAFIYFQF